MSSVMAQTATVRRMREAAVRHRSLDHDLQLPGRRPARRLVVLGDSAAAGHGISSADEALPRRLGRAMAADGTAVRVRSLAKDGATTAAVAEHQLPLLGPTDVVIVGVGVNDALRRSSAARVRQDTRRLLTALGDTAPAAKVVLLTCPDLSVAPALPAALRGVLGWRCRTVARAQCSVATDLDVPAVLLDRAMLRPEVFGPDGFHPGPVGIAALVDLVMEHLPGAPH